MYINTMVLNFDSKEELEFYKKHLDFCIKDESCYYARNEDEDDLWLELYGDDGSVMYIANKLKRLQNLYNFTDEKALEVAKEGENGVIFEINKLEEEFGFDCSSYYQALSFIDEEKLDAPLSENKIPERYDDTSKECTNLCLRDRLYRELGIYDQMQKAYEKMEDAQNKSEIEMEEI